MVEVKKKKRKNMVVKRGIESDNVHCCGEMYDVVVVTEELDSQNCSIERSGAAQLTTGSTT